MNLSLVEQSKQAIIKCPECREIYSRNCKPPKLFPCNHIMCAYCIQKALYTSPNIECLVCHAVYLNNNTFPTDYEILEVATQVASVQTQLSGRRPSHSQYTGGSDGLANQFSGMNLGNVGGGGYNGDILRPTDPYQGIANIRYATTPTRNNNINVLATPYIHHQNSRNTPIGGQFRNAFYTEAPPTNNIRPSKCANPRCHKSQAVIQNDIYTHCSKACQDSDPIPTTTNTIQQNNQGFGGSLGWASQRVLSRSPSPYRHSQSLTQRNVNMNPPLRKIQTQTSGMGTMTPNMRGDYRQGPYTQNNIRIQNPTFTYNRSPFRSARRLNYEHGNTTPHRSRSRSPYASSYSEVLSMNPENNSVMKAHSQPTGNYDYTPPPPMQYPPQPDQHFQSYASSPHMSPGPPIAPTQTITLSPGTPIQVDMGLTEGDERKCIINGCYNQRILHNGNVMPYCSNRCYRIAQGYPEDDY